MQSILSHGEYSVHQSQFKDRFNIALLKQFIAANDLEDIKKTHYFYGRFENIYLKPQHAPLLWEIKADVKHHVNQLLGQPVLKIACWFNAMGPAAKTTLHYLDDDDELLSGVYYVHVPENSGALIIHSQQKTFCHTLREGQWVFFSPQTPHAVSENILNALRLSIAFNFN